MLPLLWPRIAWRVSSETPAARSRRPTVCRKSCTCSVRKPSGAGSAKRSWSYCASKAAVFWTERRSSMIRVLSRMRRDEQTVYLIPPFYDDEEAQKVLGRVFVEVFERELFGWHTD